MKKMRIFIMLVAMALITAACGTTNSGNEESKNEVNTQKDAENIVIDHKFDSTKVTKNPETVVVFDYGTLDTLHKLGVEVAAIPKTTLPTYLSEYKDDKYVNVGSLKEPDFEKISELQPDLIIISTRQVDLYDEFSKIGPTIYLEIDTNDYLQSFKDNTKTLGMIFEKEVAVEEELAKIDTAITDLQQQVTEKADEKGLIILANDGKVSAYGTKSRFGMIHDVFGITPADENIEVSRHGQSISFEYIVEKDPDYLFVVDRGAVVGGESSAKQVVENELVKKTKAYKNNQVVYLDPNYWYLSDGGLTSVMEMVKEIENGIN